MVPLLLLKVASPALPMILLPRLPLLKIFPHTVVAGNVGVAHATEGAGTAHDLIAVATCTAVLPQPSALHINLFLAFSISLNLQLRFRVLCSSDI